MAVLDGSFSRCVRGCFYLHRVCHCGKLVHGEKLRNVDLYETRINKRFLKNEKVIGVKPVNSHCSGKNLVLKGMTNPRYK